MLLFFILFIRIVVNFLLLDLMLLKGLNCESPVKEPLLKSCFLDIDNLKEIENVNRRGWRASKHVEFGQKTHLMNV